MGNDSMGKNESLLNMHYRNNLTYYLMGIGGSTVCCLGTIANALSVAVLTRRAMRSSTYMYLAALAICDSLVLFCTLLVILKDTRPPDSPNHLYQFHAVLFPFIHPTAVVFQVTSVWLTLAFTVDRYIMICHPFKAERMCRRSRARKVVVGIYIGGLLFNIPKYLEYYTQYTDFRLANSSEVYTIYGIETTDLGKNEIFRELVHSWLYLICVCGVPFCTLVVLNAFLIRAVHLSRQKGKELNAREKHRNDTTIMLIGVIIIFLICQGPALVSRMIYAFNPISTKDKNIFTLNEVGSFLVILNSAINIVPYYLFGRKFRSEFWRLFCSCFFDKDELRRIVRSYSNSIDHRRMSQYNGMEMNSVAVKNGAAGGRDVATRAGMVGMRAFAGPSTPGMTIENGGQKRVYTCYSDLQRYPAGERGEELAANGGVASGGTTLVKASSPARAYVSVCGDENAITASTACTSARNPEACDSVSSPLISSSVVPAPSNSYPYANGSLLRGHEEEEKNCGVVSNSFPGADSESNRCSSHIGADRYGVPCNSYTGGDSFVANYYSGVDSFSVPPTSYIGTSSHDVNANSYPGAGTSSPVPRSPPSYVRPRPISPQISRIVVNGHVEYMSVKAGTQRL